MKWIFIALLLTSCVKFDYKIISIEPVGNDYYVVYTINQLKREALLDEYSLDKLLEVVNVGVY